MSGRGLALVSIQAAGMVSVLRNMCTPRAGELEKSWLQPRASRQHLNSGLFSQEEPGAR